MKQFKKGLFVRQSHLTRSQREQLDLLRVVMECQREAGEETGVLTREGVRALGHCLLGTTAMLDVLPHIGIQGAQLLRCGLFFIGEKAGWTNMVMIGHPDAPPVSQLWNAHALVRVGNLLLDTTVGQVRDTWNAAPDVAVFEMKQGAGQSVQLPGRHVVSEIARGSWNDRRGSFPASLFRLPPDVERATREWKGRPDARPERRADLVARTLELVRERRPGIGKISIPVDLRVAAETLGLPSQESTRLLSLPKGSFIARGPDVSDEPVEVHIRKPRTVLDGTIEMKTAAAEPVLTGETLVVELRAAGIGERDSSRIGKVRAEDDTITLARQIASEKSGAATASSCSDAALAAILQLLASSPKKSLPVVALSLLLRGESARMAIDAALLDLRRRRLIVGHKRLVITVAGARLVGNATRPSRTLAERIGAIRLSLPKDAVRILDALSAVGQAVATAEIAPRIGGAEKSRKLRKLLAQLSRAGLVRKRQGHFVIAPGYAALTDL